MSALIETKHDEQIEADADKAVGLILSGLGSVHPFVKTRIRQAYLLGRAHQAAQNLDTMIKTVRTQAANRNIADYECAAIPNCGWKSTDNYRPLSRGTKVGCPRCSGDAKFVG